MKVFVTGATSGIGLACARRFAKEGASLVVNARRAGTLDDVARDLRAKHGVAVEAVPFDVRVRGEVEAATREHADAFRDVDLLLNNAGLSRGLDTVQEGNPDDWDEMIDTNVKGLLLVTRAVLPGMVARGRGHVVNIGSTAGHWVYRAGAVYCASKHAVRAINEGLRLDVHGTGVRVTSVDPGLVETNFSVVRFHGDKDRAKAVYQGMTPLSPEDVADAVWWAASRPGHVNVQEIVLMPTDQASVRDVIRRNATP